MPNSISLTLIGKPGCHLCDDARAVIQSVLADFQANHDASGSVTLKELDILQDEHLAQKYHDEIPVLLINGAVHNYWRIDPVRLRGALEALL